MHFLFISSELTSIVNLHDLLSKFLTMKGNKTVSIILILLTIKVVQAAKRQGVVKRGSLALTKTREQRLKEINYTGSFISSTCPFDFPHPLEVIMSLVRIH